MSERYGMGNTSWELVHNIPRIEITPSDNYGLSDIHTRIVPELEKMAGCKLNSNVTYSKEGDHLVIELSPQRAIKHPEKHLDNAIRDVIKKYPELEKYIQITYKETKSS